MHKLMNKTHYYQEYFKESVEAHTKYKQKDNF